MRNSARPLLHREPLACLLKLRSERENARNGSGKSSWKETHRRHMRQQAADRLAVFAVEIDGVSERLEAVERDAQRECPMPFRSPVACRAGPGRKEEGHVLERGEDAQIHQQAGGNEQPPGPRLIRRTQSEPNQIVDKRGRGNEDQIKEIPLRIEEIVGEEQDSQPTGTPPGERPVEQENPDQKDEINGTGKNHREGPGPNSVFYRIGPYRPVCLSGALQSRGESPDPALLAAGLGAPRERGRSPYRAEFGRSLRLMGSFD